MQTHALLDRFVYFSKTTLESGKGPTNKASTRSTLVISHFTISCSNIDLDTPIQVNITFQNSPEWIYVQEKQNDSNG